MWKTLFYLVFILFINLIQLTFLASFQSWLSFINLSLIILMIMIFLSNSESVFAFALLSGTVFDIYSTLPFGSYLLVFFITAGLMQFLFFNFFTNKSLYSLLLMGLVGTIIFNLLLFLVFNFWAFWGLYYFADFYFYLRRIFFETLLVEIFLLIFFIPTNKLSRHFKPIFLNS